MNLGREIRTVKIVEEPDSLETDTVKRNRPKYKSDAGRVIYGGGAITPDVVVQPDTLSMPDGQGSAVSRSGRPPPSCGTVTFSRWKSRKRGRSLSPQTDRPLFRQGVGSWILLSALASAFTRATSSTRFFWGAKGALT